MKERPKDRKPHEVPRSASSYRGFRKNNSIAWKGVEADKTKAHPPLVKKVSDRGETHYVELW
jgi:hypothetical protein